MLDLDHCFALSGTAHRPVTLPCSGAVGWTLLGEGTALLAAPSACLSLSCREQADPAAP